MTKAKNASMEDKKSTSYEKENITKLNLKQIMFAPWENDKPLEKSKTWDYSLAKYLYINSLLKQSLEIQ